MLELVAGGVVVLVYLDELLLEPLEFVLILRDGLHRQRWLLLEFVQVCRPAIDIFLRF